MSASVPHARVLSMSFKVLDSPAYSRLDPAASAQLRLRRAEKPIPTRVQSAVEIALFIGFGLALAVAPLALFAINPPSPRTAPHRLAARVPPGPGKHPPHRA